MAWSKINLSFNVKPEIFFISLASYNTSIICAWLTRNPGHCKHLLTQSEMLHRILTVVQTLSFKRTKTLH